MALLRLLTLEFRNGSLIETDTDRLGVINVQPATRYNLDELNPHHWLGLFLGLSGFTTFPQSVLNLVLSKLREEAIEEGSPPRGLRDWFFNPRTAGMYSEETEAAILSMKHIGMACGWSGTDELEILVPPMTLSDPTLSRLDEADKVTVRKWASRFREILLEVCEKRGITDLPRV
jgi:hypothetical protein